MPNETRTKNHMVKLSVFLFRECGKSTQQGIIHLSNPKDKKGLFFRHLDEIPTKIREHLKRVGLTYDVADNSGNSVIVAKKTKKSKGGSGD